MNRQQEHSCIAYFKSNPVWDRVFRGFWEKYRSYGSFSGKVVLQKITAEEVEGLEGFFAKSYHGKKSVTVSEERFSQALLSSRFSNMTPEHLLELYFREKLVGRTEKRPFFTTLEGKISGNTCGKSLVRTAGCDKGRSYKKFK